MTEAAPVSPIRLQPGEQIILDVHPSVWTTLAIYIVTLGLWHPWRMHNHTIVTNQRVVIARGIVSKTEYAVRLDRIQNVAFAHSPLSGKVLISTAGNVAGSMLIKDISRQDAITIADEINARIQHHTTA